ncbi:hypothetical protein HDA44_005380 [Kribbella solani]|uniref:Uncharacterized protein n=1 Tax=Kribbella solani TaxID=236067 RepID=A0A841DVB2_9ACTN|nr:hypothetical protein [Kribbella solani]
MHEGPCSLGGTGLVVGRVLVCGYLEADCGGHLWV